ncbi:MAG TPA: deoxyribose-phosphate aldolase [Candidatus Bathyarchaeia archaeon]|nr:deoxyribose-phosphate aldolase [Candidatus Bathyarchaeia archaeon]
MDKKQLASFLDFANHRQEATPAQIRLLCQKVKEHGFHGAFVNPCFISLAKQTLTQKGAVGTVISFPLGQDSQEVKIFTAIDAVRKGADELDACLNVGLFKARKEDLVLEEMRAIIGAAKDIKKAVLVKFIIETGLLTEMEIKKAAQLVLKSGADFVKTNSGYGPRGATLKDVELIRQAVGKKIKIKVAGGIHTYDQAIAFLKKGADRVGTSKAVEIIKKAS